MIIKATQVDWLYDKDPNKFDNAKFIEEATFEDVLNQNLRVMDQTAFALAREESLEIRIVSLKKNWAILKACNKEKEWTVIRN
jgi:uridylate kinase